MSVRAMPSVSRTATSVKPSTQGWNRTNDVRFRKPALYPLSYKGVCRLVAGTSQLVFRFDGSHHPFATRHGVATRHDFRYWDDGVLRAFHATVLIYVLDPQNRSSDSQLDSHQPSRSPATVDVPPVGFEPTTQGLKDPCSNH